jgi:hypothetical protein
MNEQTFDYKEYLKSDYWKDIKQQVHKMDNNKCIICESENNLCVHHTTYDYLGNERLDLLVTLCKKCHYKYHKNNPQASYESYKHFKALKEKELTENLYKVFIDNNIEKFDEMVNILNKNNYLYYKDYINYVDNIKDKSFDNSKFLNVVSDYFDLVYIFYCGKETSSKYKLPTNINMNKNTIVVRKELYNKNKHDMHMYIRTYSLDTMDLRTIFQQTI